ERESGLQERRVAQLRRRGIRDGSGNRRGSQGVARGSRGNPSHRLSDFRFRLEAIQEGTGPDSPPGQVPFLSGHGLYLAKNSRPKGGTMKIENGLTEQNRRQVAESLAQFLADTYC